VVESRLRVAWKNQICYSHPICGHCYYRNEYHHTKEIRLCGPLRLDRRQRSVSPPRSPAWSVRSADWESPYDDPESPVHARVAAWEFRR
jgi:hypothetical protein